MTADDILRAVAEAIVREQVRPSDWDRESREIHDLWAARQMPTARAVLDRLRALGVLAL